jgi:ABC-type Fe3+/spermidine/putrescine transport system ATPase subunit
MSQTQVAALPVSTPQQQAAGAAEAPPAVEVDNVSLSFQPGTRVLDGVTLDLRAQERLCLLGPSGSGKTTLLQLIAGFLRPGEGSIRILGSDQTRVPTHRRNIGVVFQQHALFPHMSVGNNVAFGLNCRGLPKRDVHDRVAEVLDLVELGHLRDRKPRQLSGGQQQRVAVARALAVRPGVLLMDEPFSSLDTKLRRGIREEIVALQEKLLIPTVLVTHDQEEALAFGHRIAVLNGGRVEQIGTPMEVYERPGTRFVASFVGDASFLDVEICGTTPAGNLVAASGDGQLLEAQSESAVAVGSRGAILLRPEWLTVIPDDADPSGPSDGRTGLRATVQRITYVGDATDCTVAIAGQSLVASLRPGGGRYQPASVGETVQLAWAGRQPWFYPEAAEVAAT